MTSLQLSSTEIDAVQETLLGEALEHAPVGALVFDERGRYLAANRMACRVTGYAREELLELSPQELAANPEAVTAWLSQMEAGELKCGSGHMQTKDGRPLEVEYRVGATRSGGLPFFVFVFWEPDSRDC